MKIDNILINMSSSAVLFPLIISILRKKYLTKELKILFWYVIVSISGEALGTFCGRVLHTPNHFVINTFALSEGILISLILREAFINKSLKRVSLISISIYAIISIYLFTLPDGFQKFNSTVTTLSCILIITWVFVFFYQLLQALEVIKLYTLPLFWISVGSLLYFSGTLFVFLYGDTILWQKEPILYYQLWNIYYILLFMFRVLLAIGLWFSKPTLQFNKANEIA